MKRYTGQQALYEAISRSRAKAKQGSILEKLRPEPSTPEKPATQESRPPTEPEQAPEQTPGLVVPQPSELPAVETPLQPQVEQELQTQPAVDASSEPLLAAPVEPVERVEPVVKPRPVERVAHPVTPGPMQPWLRPRPVQLNEGRIEVSVPYYVGAIAGLVVIVVVLAAFRLGQAGSGGQANDAGRQIQPVADRSAAPVNPPTRSTPQNATTDTSRPPAPSTTQQNVASAKPPGDHWIVLAQYKRQEDLEPVVQHFAQQGISLGIVPLARVREFFAANSLDARNLPSGEGFLLVTKDSFDNPKVAGTDGDKMIKRIIEVGALYKSKARPGYESFAPNYFKDAYPMKIK